MLMLRYINWWLQKRIVVQGRTFFQIFFGMWHLNFRLSHSNWISWSLLSDNGPRKTSWWIYEIKDMQVVTNIQNKYINKLCLFLYWQSPYPHNILNLVWCLVIVKLLSICKWLNNNEINKLTNEISIQANPSLS